MGEFRGGEIPCESFASCAADADTSSCESLEFHSMPRSLRAHGLNIRSSCILSPAMEPDFGGETLIV